MRERDIGLPAHVASNPQERDWLSRAEYGPGVRFDELLYFNRNFAIPLAVQSQAFLERAFSGLPEELQTNISSREGHVYNVVMRGLEDLADTWSDAFGIVPPRIEDFSFSLPGEDEAWDERRLQRLIDGVNGLIDATNNWLPKEPRIVPFFVLLPEAFPELPREVTVGENQVLQRQFDRVFVPFPGTCEEGKVAVIFDHLASLYDDELVDLGLKKALLTIFLGLGLKIDADRSCRVLDVGCGTGMAYELKPPKWRVVGVDLSSQMCHFARRKGMEAYQASASQLPFPDDSFDGAIASYSVHWFQDDRPFQEIYRVLKRGRENGEGGFFIFNWYKPPQGWPGLVRQRLQTAGFGDMIKMTTMELIGEKAYREALVRARKV